MDKMQPAIQRTQGRRRVRRTYLPRRLAWASADVEGVAMLDNTGITQRIPFVRNGALVA